MVATEEYQRMMYYKFLLVSQLLFEYLVRFLGRFRFHDPDSVHNPVHMSVHSDIGGIVENREDYFCSLHPHS